MTQERTLRAPVTFPGIVHVSENKNEVEKYTATFNIKIT
jgi:hypothetical protein